MADIKKEFKHFLDVNNLEAVSAHIICNPRKFPHLIRMAYEKDTLAGWRSIIAIRLIARELAATSPEFLRETCRKLLWSMSDESGGIGWSAPEILGEIVSADPRQFAEFIPLIVTVYDVDEEVFRAGVLYALGRIAETAPEWVSRYEEIILRGLEDSDPLVRIRALELIQITQVSGASSGLWSDEYNSRIRDLIKKLLNDDHEAWIYRESDFISVQVSQEASRIFTV